MAERPALPFEVLDGNPLLHNLRVAVREHGLDRAREMYPAERRFLEAIANALGEDSRASGAVYSGFATTSLPHKKLSDDAVWERHGHRLKLKISPGTVRLGDGREKAYGVPYGSRARVLLYYCQTTALLTKSREIEMGPSLHAWIERLQLPDGGQIYKDIREQLLRLAACSLVFDWDPDPQRQIPAGRMKSNFISGTMGLNNVSMLAHPAQGSLWQETILLDADFYTSLQDHAVPLWEPAIRELSSNSAAMDVYIWLAYRLRWLSEPRRVSWLALHEQFGGGYARLRDFRKRFIDTLKNALSVYEDAIVVVDDEGVVLHPSRPPVPERSPKRIV